jgi:hypothetical protein
LNLVTNTVELNEYQKQFLDWLLNRPIINGRPQSLRAKASEWRKDNPDAPSETTLLWWKNHDGPFIKAWQHRLLETWGHPETEGAIMEALIDQAKSGNMKAVELYLKFRERIDPKTAETAGAETLSDEELETLAARIKKGL